MTNSSVGRFIGKEICHDNIFCIVDPCGGKESDTNFKEERRWKYIRTLRWNKQKSKSFRYVLKNLPMCHY